MWEEEDQGKTTMWERGGGRQGKTTMCVCGGEDSGKNDDVFVGVDNDDVHPR